MLTEMFDTTKPIPLEVIMGSIVFIFVLIGLGLLAVRYYKRKG
jgi:hypothetical protein